MGGALRDSLNASSVPFARILLVGFMGSGKSTVGPLLASQLGWQHVDLDEEIERRTGRSVPSIFREDGEPAFRAIEEQVARELLGPEEVVVSPGGGWPCRDGRMEALSPGTLSIWLVVSPERAVERAKRHGAERPLLAGEDPVARARELLAARERYYGVAHWRVDTEARSPEEVVRVVIERLTQEPARPLRA
ncbi:MAG: shikimate kinase [Gemmatimonadetes bacterium]|nr:shikimate kinase [Gemmatimonadota bacterium]